MTNAYRDPLRPWGEEFDEYYDSRPEILPPEVSMVSWWGACLGPPSDVAERAFSSGGITISKDMFQSSPVASIDEDDDPPSPDDNTEGSWDCFLDDNTENYEPHVIAA
ncbi:hypothetical protein B0H14DRAFT_3531977 [Mycena olivaceomarginata]|nr:hypothetical protein B0H14DRAFT_3531977 [Mycena olivaceomarginata]